MLFQFQAENFSNDMTIFELFLVFEMEAKALKYLFSYIWVNKYQIGLYLVIQEQDFLTLDFDLFCLDRLQ